MRRLSPRTSLLLGLAVSVAVAAVIAVVAITAGGSDSRTAPTAKGAGATSAASRQRAAAHGVRSAHAELAAAARYLGVSVTRLRRELRRGKTLSEVVRRAPGKTEAGLIDAIMRGRSTETNRSFVRHGGARVNALGGESGRSILPSFREDAREYLGLTVPQLRDYAKGGKSLAQIVRTIPGRSEAGMVDALFNDRKRQLEAAVKAGRLRPDVEKLTLLHLRERVRTYVRFVPPSGKA